MPNSGFSSKIDFFPKQIFRMDNVEIQTENSLENLEIDDFDSFMTFENVLKLFASTLNIKISM